MEMLIVIAIPAFTSQLDSANESTAKANGRSLYAVLMADYMEDNDLDTAIAVGSGSATTVSSIDGTTALTGELTVVTGEVTQKIDIPNGYNVKITGTDGTSVVMPTVVVSKGDTELDTFALHASATGKRCLWL